MSILVLIGILMMVVSTVVLSDKKWAKYKTEAIIAVLLGAFCVIVPVAMMINEPTSKETSQSNSSSELDNENSSNEESESSKADVSYLIADTYDETEASENASQLTYGDLMKSNKYLGESYKLKNLRVSQAFDDGVDTELMAYDGSDLYHISYRGETPAVKDSIINVTGVIMEQFNYDTSIGGNNTVPNIAANQIEIVEK